MEAFGRTASLVALYSMAVAVASVRRIQERFVYSSYIALWDAQPSGFYASAGQSEIIASIVAPALAILFVSPAPLRHIKLIQRQEMAHS